MPRTNDEGEDDERPRPPPCSDRLAPAPERPPHRRTANRSRTASASGAGCAGAWHGADRLAGKPLRPRSAAGSVTQVQDRLEGMAPDWLESSAAVALRELQTGGREALPEDSAALLAALLAKPQDELVRLLAVCVASTVDVVTPRHAAPARRRTGAGRGLDMAVRWQPTAEGSAKTAFQSRDSGCRGRVCTRIRHPAGEAQEGRHQRKPASDWPMAGWIPAIFKPRGPQDGAGSKPGAGTPRGCREMADEPAERR